MMDRCSFCYWTPGLPLPVEGWVESIQLFMDRQPHPTRVDGLIPCDLRVFEDDMWFCVVEREPLAEGHVRLVCRNHLTDLGQLRGPSDAVEAGVVEATRSTLMDDLIIAHDVVRAYDPRIVDVMVLGGAMPDAHMFFDLVPVYRFDHGTLSTLGEIASGWEDMNPAEKRKRWEAHIQDYEEMAQRLREAAGRVIRTRPGRRRAGLLAGDEGD